MLRCEGEHTIFVIVEHVGRDYQTDPHDDSKFKANSLVTPKPIQPDEQVDAAIEKAGDMVDEKTGGKFEGQVDQAQDLLQEKTGEGDTSA